MVTFRNNSNYKGRRPTFRNNNNRRPSFRRNNDDSSKFQSSNFQRKMPSRNNNNAPKLIEKYNDLAREALASEDKILSESYFQYADHFTRVQNEQESNRISRISSSSISKTKPIINDEINEVSTHSKEKDNPESTEPDNKKIIEPTEKKTVEKKSAVS